jgi:hypothetical protein
MVSKFFLFEDFNLSKVPPQFWKDLDDVASLLAKNGNFWPYWDLKKKYPEVMNEDEGDVSDNFLVRLHNRNIVTKRINFAQWLYLTLKSWDDFYSFLAKQQEAPSSFSEWYKNGTITAYRGSTGPLLPLGKNDYKSFTLSEEMAVRFTQPGWSSPRGAWKDVNEQNGFVGKVTVRVANVHFFNHEGYEYEVILKGPLDYDEVVEVKKGKILRRA